jgi:NAD-dependent deacetylase
MVNLEQIGKLKSIVDNSKRIVFFGGAGASTESGIPDFRSVDGLYNTEYKYPPETIISHSFFLENPSEFFRFYRNKMLFPDAESNECHKWLAGNSVPVITQNIDGLHQKAGSKEVYELHGSVWRNYCTNCNEYAGFDEIVKLIDEADDNIPHCQKCKTGILKPDVVLYQEGLNSEVWSGAEQALRKADTLIVGGTSLIVYPAASMVRNFLGDNLVVINRDPLTLDGWGDVLQINDSLGEVFSKLQLKTIERNNTEKITLENDE